MSYEGSVQIICKNDHYLEDGDRSMFFDYQAEWKCAQVMNGKSCGAAIKDMNSVDDTNCDSWGYRKPIQIEEPSYHTCACGDVHITSAATFRLGKKQYWRDHLTGEWKLIRRRGGTGNRG